MAKYCEYYGRVWIESEVGKGSVFFFTLQNQEMKVADDADMFTTRFQVDF